MPSRHNRRRRRLILGFLVVVALVAGKPAWHVLSTMWGDVDRRAPLPAGYVDDASRMNATPVAEVWPIPSDAKVAERQLTELLSRAQRDGLPVSIAGARHTMGGHTIARDGVVVDMAARNAMSLDKKRTFLHVGAGARWSEVIGYLDPRGLSVAVMQSNNSFSVGGSLSCNCHGWQFGKPPIASTVESLRLMTADGNVLRCSRDENPELFSLVLGGYGLFGVILDVELRVVSNERYRLRQFIVPSADALATFDHEIAARNDVAMAYARLCVTPTHFLEEAIINVLVRDPAPDGSLPALSSSESIALRRSLFRGSAGSDYGKELRWAAEVRLQPHLTNEHFSRNQLLNEGVEVFQNRSADTTDILHEYFVPREQLARFVGDVRRIVPQHRGDLLNVTVRYVDEDHDAFLRYADQPIFALVMLFQQATSAAGDARMVAMTRDLVDAALAAGGRYYLPYRLHPTREQFARAYPMGAKFFERKRHYDPSELFRNEFYERYGRAAAAD